jgi:O-antigen ligase
MPTSSFDDFVRRVASHRNTAEVAGGMAAIAVGWLVGKSIAGGKYGFVGMLLGFLAFFLIYFRPRSMILLFPFVISMPNLSLGNPGPMAVSVQDAFWVVAFTGYVSRQIVGRKFIIPRNDNVIAPLWGFLAIAIICIYKVMILKANLLVFNTKELMRLTMFSFTYIVMLDVLNSKKQIMRLTWWILIWGIWMMAISYYSYFTVSDFWYDLLVMKPAYIFMRHKFLRMISIAGSTSWTGIYYAILVALGIQFAPFFKTRERRVWAIVYIIAMAGCILLTFNRGTWVGMLAGGVVLLLQGHIDRRRVAGAVILLLGLAVLVSTSIFTPDAVGQQVTDFVHYSRGSAESRVTRWVSAVNAVIDQPLLGVGFNNFAFLLGHYSDESGVNAERYGSPHNMFVDILTGTGLIGFSVFMLMIIRLHRQMKDNMDGVLPPDLKLLSRGLYLSYIFFLGASMFDSFIFKLHHTSYLIAATWAMTSAIRRLRLGLVQDPEMAEFAAQNATAAAEKKT